MQDVVTGLQETRAAIARAARDFGRRPEDVTLIAVSKTKPAEAILPVLEAGQVDFGENYVQEAKAKWPELRERAFVISSAGWPVLCSGALQPWPQSVCACTALADTPRAMAK